MPVTYLVNKNIVASPKLVSNVSCINESEVTFIFSDDLKNMYVGGNYNDGSSVPISIPNMTPTGPSTSVYNTVSSAITGQSQSFPSSGFISKYDSSGTLIWSIVIGGNYVRVNDGCLNIDQNSIFVALSYFADSPIYIPTGTSTGGVQGTSPISPLVNTFSGLSINPNGSNGAIVKINKTGAPLWSSLILTNTTEFGTMDLGCMSVKVDSLGFVYTSVYYVCLDQSIPIINSGYATSYTSTVSLPSFSTASFSYYNNNISIIKYTNDGIALLASYFYPTDNFNIHFTQNSNNSGLIIDRYNQLYFIMNYSIDGYGTIGVKTTIDGTGRLILPNLGGGPPGAGLIKFNNSLIPQWSSSLGSTGGILYWPFYFNSVTVSIHDTVYICGAFTAGSAGSGFFPRFYDGNGQNVPTSGTIIANVTANDSSSTQYAFLTKYQASTGKCLWTSFVDVPINTIPCRSFFNKCVVDKSDVNVYVGGTYQTGDPSYGNTGLNVINSDGSVTVIVPSTTIGYSNGILLRYFLGRVMTFAIEPSTSGISYSNNDYYNTFGFKNNPIGINCMSINELTTNMYIGGTYNNTNTTPLFSADGLGGTTIVANLPITGATSLNGFFANYG
jgi:hypothetical protein